MPRSPFANLHVLIVDQDSFAAKLMNQVLLSFEFAGINVARTAVQARDVLVDSKVDIVLCDWLPEEENPLIVVDYIRRGEESPNTTMPIVMYTGYTEMARIIDARDAGVNEILAKPIAPQQVLKKLQSVLHSNRQFVESEGYVGPDRRRRNVQYDGPERRGKYGLKQDQIDTVMRQKSDQ